MKRALAIVAVAVVVLGGSSTTASAHVGSPDVYFEGAAGPYRVLVTVRPPDAVPGIAEVSARVTDSIDHMTMVPLPAQGIGAKLSPTPDVATRDRDDPRTFVGHLWLMQAGTWQVRLAADGPRGHGELAVPVPALPARTKKMQTALGVGLLALLLLLAWGAISIAGSGARDASLEPGVEPSPEARRRGLRAKGVAAVVVVVALVGGNAWWNAEASDYARYVYKPLGLHAHVDDGVLALQLEDPGWLKSRQLDDLVPDHDHLMHLYVVREPAMDRVWHLHPEATGGGAFRYALPAMEAGRYRLWADVVHASGLAETAVAEIELPAIAGAPLDGDNATGSGPATFEPARTIAPLDDGARMVWLRDDAPYRARRAGWFRFRVEDAAGAAQPLEPYMGMMGHAAFVRRDGSTFAHVHPTGSVPMASIMALDGAGDGNAMAAMHAVPAGATEVAFPYGFPRAGDYRIFVQVKRAGHIETGVFDAHAE
ncbi:MAG TPA: hypothetical protein VN947_05775 [Polyangia bacterium]|nr:hypothetical protein [Polyangia bacterium]